MEILPGRFMRSGEGKEECKAVTWAAGCCFSNAALGDGSTPTVN